MADAFGAEGSTDEFAKIRKTFRRFRCFCRDADGGQARTVDPMGTVHSSQVTPKRPAGGGGN